MGVCGSTTTPFPLLSVRRCFNVVVSVAVEAAGSGPGSRVLYPLGAEVVSGPGRKSGVRFAAPLASAAPPSPQSIEWESPLRQHRGQL